ncbi:MAG: RdgB/HAM1 family non-canonical purine NTP pyrophosphatase [Chitinophagales bacterium]|nr:RdgB/HAM1 family non-canonical purine NTP pyrophosphatase [Chitinophagales bacterium]MCZ2394735.1 RdgB/HAM1 family non-canonical purine NTP pyrophosphatase [Chitinophagales bacterium]
MQLILATSNSNKVKEIANLLPNKIELLSLKDIHYIDEIPEDHDNIEDNSLQKAMTIWQFKNINCLAEDTGLFIAALNNEPGVYSARYAGEQKNEANNIQKVLSLLGDNPNRKAYFKTVFTLVLKGVAYQFTGIFEGNITLAPRGNQGFGYDPIFEIASGKTLAEIPLDEKKKISHRGIALKKVIQFLESQ